MTLRHELADGDAVVTAGEALPCTNDISPYPPGLLIGEIVDVSDRSEHPRQECRPSQPAAHLTDATFVLVIVDYQGGFGPPVPSAGPAAVASGSGSVRHRAPTDGRPAKPGASPITQCSRSAVAWPAGGVPAKPDTLDAHALTGAGVKGLVLAGGTATRLFPLTIVTNKHLLPIYDRPMIYYPIETLAGMGIREVMVIVGGKSVGDVVELLADGEHFGLDLTYRYQRGALGIAHAIGLARDFVGDDAFCCVLGDNILLGPPLAGVAREFEAGPWGAGTLLYEVADPERFGVAEFDAAGNVVGFEEKPAVAQEQPDPDRRVLPAARRLRRRGPPRPVARGASWRSPIS